MDCQKCGRQPATVFMTTVVGKELRRTDLCEACARQDGTLSAEGLLSPEGLIPERPSVARESSDACPACGYLADTLQKSGRLGCACCYEKFSTLVQEALRDSQPSLLHSGKRPGRKHARHQDLEAELELLVRAELFEEAAKIRDRIAQMRPGPRTGKTE